MRLDKNQVIISKAKAVPNVVQIEPCFVRLFICPDFNSQKGER